MISSQPSRKTLRNLLEKEAPDLLVIVPEELHSVEITLLEPEEFYATHLRDKLERVVNRLCTLCYKPPLVH